MRELSFISKIRARAARMPGSRVVKGIGDDCAVVLPEKGAKLLLTTDSLAEGTHFNRCYFKPWEIGARAMAVNISDICAMGGVPRYALVSIGFSKKEKQGFVDSVYEGLMRYAENYGIELIGGDTVGSSVFFLSVTLAGESKRGRLLMRDGAKKGDLLFTTGMLGDSYAGLLTLKRKGREKLSAFEYLPVKKHLVPLPRYMEGRLLAESGYVTSCIDISDGLVNDCMQLSRESGCGMIIEAQSVPVSHSAGMIAQSRRENAVDYALYGGEDFELLFTVPKSKEAHFMNFMSSSGVPVFCIGRVTGGRSVKIRRGKSLENPEEGRIWNHF
jgi:thiamine-monophosphate kinase